MKRPSIGVVIATPGRRSILRTLASISYQGIEEGDDVLVVGDGYHEPTAELVSFLGAPFRYVATEKTRDWGHSQFNYGLKHVRGDWVTGQDDDDIFLPRAFDEIRSIVEGLKDPCPIIGRVVTPYLGILWTEPGRQPLDGHCLVVPNDKSKLGYMGLDYAGDQTWLASNMAEYDTYTWADRVWTLTRPHWKLWPVLLEVTGACRVWVFYRDEGGTQGTERVAELMTCFKHGHWNASPSFSVGVTDEEIREVMEFAAWAGQGEDVWVRISALMERAADQARASGYEMHREEDGVLEFVSEWPPEVRR